MAASTIGSSIALAVSSKLSAAQSAATTGAAAVANQAGILEGGNPTHYNASNPVILFIIQAGIVIIFCQLLNYPLRLLNEPRVIAEVIGGILLGPSVMMRIPGFQQAIFPKESMPIFNNVANLGLIIFLFIVGLEVDVRLFTKNWKAAMTVGVASMALPFGLGYAIAWGLYENFHDNDRKLISFGVYGLFIGTALAITAFPVLCRILTELKLLQSFVGVTTLAAGVGNDVTGWILLALCVALVKNNSGLAALWALLACVGWVLFLIYAVRPPFVWILRRTGSLQNGPTQGIVALTMLMTLTSAWFTGVIGIHAIFGAFLVGVICPHDGGFAIKLAEKIEDLISVLFLPLYFALSGLSTNVGLLNDGKTWGYVIAVIACAFAGKIVGGTLAARLNKLLWRESFAIGCLMSCKGLVELIVLNIGLQAGILDQKTFTMFVVMALVTTVATTPLTKWLYPPSYQQKVAKWRRGEIDWDGNPIQGSSSSEPLERLNATRIRRLLVYLRLDALPSLFTLITLLGRESDNITLKDTQNSAHTELSQPSAEKKHETLPNRNRLLEVHGLRILELTDRTSSVMQVTAGEELYSMRDPVVNAFRTFSQLHDVAVSGRVAVVPCDSYAETLIQQASDVASDFALIPWSESGSVTEDQSIMPMSFATERFTSSTHLEFINTVFLKASTTCNAGVFIDNGFGGISKPVDRPKLQRTQSSISFRSHCRPHELASLPVVDRSHHIFFPLIGGDDDRVALRLVLQLSRNTNITATIAHFTWPADVANTVVSDDEASDPRDKKTDAFDKVTAQDISLLASLQRSSLPPDLVERVKYCEVAVTSATCLRETLSMANLTIGQAPKNAGDVVVLGRRHSMLNDLVGSSNGSELRKVVGVVANEMILEGIKASLLVVQAVGGI